MYSRHQGELTGDQIRSSKTAVLCMPSTPREGNEDTLFCSKIHHFKVHVIAGDANAAAKANMQREVNTGRPFESRLHIDYCTNNYFSASLSK